jgi:dTDP-4-dehydrorhamnose reductase
MTILKNLFSRKRNILVLGCDGMLGFDVYSRLKSMSRLADSSIGAVIGLDIKDGYDFSRPHTLGNFLDSSIRFDCCVNCIAHTDTSAAQNTKEGFLESYRLNALVPKCISESCRHHKVRLIHISTDYVFSEKSIARPIDLVSSTDQIDVAGTEFPVNAYGTHKLIGELFLKNEFANNPSGYAILRTSWLYGSHNRKSFVHRFLKNVKSCILENRKIEVTQNEYSVPTSTDYLVQRIIDVLETDACGTFNAVPNCKDALVSRRDFAESILRHLPECLNVDGMALNDLEVLGIVRDAYQPIYSMMKSSFEDTLGWDHYLRRFINDNASDLAQYLETA